jgi:hypothetical protein
MLHVSGHGERLKGGPPATKEKEVDDDVIQARQPERVSAGDGLMRPTVGS